MSLPPAFAPTVAAAPALPAATSPDVATVSALPAAAEPDIAAAPSLPEAGEPEIAAAPSDFQLPKSMPNSFTPLFVELTGSVGALDTLNVSAADSGRIIQGTVTGALVSYQVSAGDDAEDSPGIIRPANFHAGTNAYVFRLIG